MTKDVKTVLMMSVLGLGMLSVSYGLSVIVGKAWMVLH
jgi:hypothetical protein